MFCNTVRPMGLPRVTPMPKSRGAASPPLGSDKTIVIDRAAPTRRFPDHPNFFFTLSFLSPARLPRLRPCGSRCRGGDSRLRFDEEVKVFFGIVEHLFDVLAGLPGAFGELQRPCAFEPADAEGVDNGEMGVGGFGKQDPSPAFPGLDAHIGDE